VVAVTVKASASAMAWHFLAFSVEPRSRAYRALCSVGSSWSAWVAVRATHILCASSNRRQAACRGGFGGVAFEFHVARGGDARGSCGGRRPSGRRGARRVCRNAAKEERVAVGKRGG
jgi:hypothetical protein